MNSIQKKLHIGIYGLIEQDHQFLLIRKSRGPYKGLFDLPGGRPSHGEPLLKALTREILEETGVRAKTYSLLDNFSYLTSYIAPEGNMEQFYHIALIYRVMSFDVKNFNPNIKDEDANGSLWVHQNDIQSKDCSPLVRSILERYKKNN